uniref:Uncharacterized protein n=1 Tax=Siphoviridae sp. ctg2r17 TaxID=2825601 RepID=A0A8S5P093_9CAUD|nr:MAG TPA: hypothetical protein [Siphoviridae sp. ctg2r17]
MASSRISGQKKTPQKRGVFIQQRLLITTIAQI